MRRLRAPWLGALAVLAALTGAGLVWLGIYLRRRGLDFDAKLSEVVGAAVAVGGPVASAFGRVARWLPAPRLNEDQIQSDVADLAAALRVQGRSEGVLSGRYVYDRLPMPVRWKPAADLSSGPELRSSDAAFRTDSAAMPAGTFDEVLEYFRALPESRLLVLGDAGAGKTVLVTELARRLLATRTGSDPVPVVIPLTAWDPDQVSLFDWVSEQLVRINADLARRVRDGRRYATRAQALVDRMKVLPILDGLDEVAEKSRPQATIAVNQYGWAQPLVVTCRTSEYLQVISAERGTPIARVAAVVIQPLDITDIKEYLGREGAGGWRPVYERLDAEPDGPIARALANPLMLWLAWAVYSAGGRQPSELTDRRLFGSVDAIEHHLLAQFVPALYLDGVEKAQPGSTEQAGWWQVVRQRPQSPERWLGFLAADAVERYRQARSTKRTRARRPINLFEARDDQNVAWWRFTGAAGPLRIVSVALRGYLLWAVIWRLIRFLLTRDGYLRHGSFAGPLHYRRLFLSGPAGQAIWPAVRRVIDVVPVPTRQHAFTDISNFVHVLLQHHSSEAVYLALGLALVIAGIRANEEPARPRRLHLSIRSVGQFAWAVLWAVVFLAFAVWVVLANWHQTGLASSVFTARSTWYAIMAVALALCVPGFPARLAVATDVVGAVGPLDSLRMDRAADIVVTVSGRATFTAVILLFSGTELAITYLIFATASTAVALLLGGRGPAASRSYTDACIWLALTDRMPWRPMRFLADAQRRGVFQEIGAIYRFRHERVQRQLRDWYRFWRPGIREWPAAYHRMADRLTASRGATLAGARERSASYRALADRNFAEFGSDLAQAQSMEAVLLRAQGYRDEELDVLGQLVTTRRMLAELDPVDRPALASSLIYFARRLDAAGRYDQTRGPMIEATETICQLGQAGRQEHLPQLEDALTWLARRDGPEDRIVAAGLTIHAVLAAYSECVRAEAYSDPDEHGAALLQLGALLRRHPRIFRLTTAPAAADVLSEAAQMYAANARAEPTAILPSRARALRDLGVELAALGRSEEARTALADSAALYRRLTHGAQAQYRPLLISALCRLATMDGLSREQQLAAIRDAVAEYRVLASESPVHWAGDDNGSIRGLMAGATTTAGASAPGTAASSDGAAVDLLPGLDALARRLWRLGVHDEAIEAAVIGRELSAAMSADSPPAGLGRQQLIWNEAARPPMGGRGRFQHLLASTPWRLEALVEQYDAEAFRLRLAGRLDESEARARNAAEYCQKLVGFYRNLAETLPAQNLADLAESLEQLAALRSKTGSADADSGARSAAAEAAEIRRRLSPVASSPAPDEQAAAPAACPGRRWDEATLEPVDD